MNGIFKFTSRLLIINFVAFAVFLLVFEKNPYLNAKVNSATQKENTFETTVHPSITPTIKLVKMTPTPSTKPPQTDFNAEFIVHNTPADCWLKINGHVYDITGYFGKHPGGDSYLVKYCGKDATVGFNSKDSIPAKIHTAAAQLILSGYLIQ